MKQIVAYDTVTGRILGVTYKAGDSVILASGDGIVTDGVLVSPALSGVTFDKSFKFIITFSGGQKRGVMNMEKITDTSINVSYWIRPGDEGSVSFIMTSLGPASQFSDNERDNLVAALKSDLGKDTVAGLKVDAPGIISAQEWVVDLDTCKLKKSDQITYE